MTSILLIIRIDRKKFKINTGEKVNPVFWDGDPNSKYYQRVKRNTPVDFIGINDRLDELLVIAKRVCRDYLSKNDNYADYYDLSQLLKEAIRPELITTKGEGNLIAFIEGFIEDSKSRINTQTGLLISPINVKKYRTTLR
jgi:hypothetical protein